MKLAEYNAIAERHPKARKQYRGALVSVHGMNTRAAWQKVISPLLQDKAIRHKSVDYGTVRLGIFKWGKSREIAEQVVEAYREQCSAYRYPSLLGHSFGTCVVGTALKRHPDLCVRRVILVGCILRRDYPWAALASEGQVREVLNEACPGDPLPKLAGLVKPWKWGRSGCKGFVGADSVVLNRSYRFTGHSGLLTALHCERTLIPFILHGLRAVARNGT